MTRSRLVGVAIAGALASMAGCQILSGLGGLHADGSGGSTTSSSGGGHGGAMSVSASGSGGGASTVSSSSSGGGHGGASTVSSSSSGTGGNTDGSTSSSSTTTSSSSSGACDDHAKNGNETDVDCGGGACPKCQNGLHCGVDGDCAANGCNLGICGLGSGQSCVSKTQCQSGFCADGVCCDTSCVDTCKACNLTNHVGICTAVPRGQADGTCPAPTAACDGAGQCKFGLGVPCMDDSECASTFMHCVDGVCCSTACTGVCQACNVTGSLGTCTNMPAGVQDPNGCQSAGQACDGLGACRFSCTSTQECTTGGFSSCLNGFCH